MTVIAKDSFPQRNQLNAINMGASDLHQEAG
jgi:hypothetical protein